MAASGVAEVPEMLPGHTMQLHRQCVGALPRVALLFYTVAKHARSIGDSGKIYDVPRVAVTVTVATNACIALKYVSESCRVPERY